MFTRLVFILFLVEISAASTDVVSFCEGRTMENVASVAIHGGNGSSACACRLESSGVVGVLMMVTLKASRVHCDVMLTIREVQKNVSVKFCSQDDGRISSTMSQLYELVPSISLDLSPASRYLSSPYVVDVLLSAEAPPGLGKHVFLSPLKVSCGHAAVAILPVHAALAEQSTDGIVTTAGPTALIICFVLVAVFLTVCIVATVVSTRQRRKRKSKENKSMENSAYAAGRDELGCTSYPESTKENQEISGRADLTGISGMADRKGSLPIQENMADQAKKPDHRFLVRPFLSPEKVETNFNSRPSSADRPALLPVSVISGQSGRTPSLTPNEMPSFEQQPEVARSPSRPISRASSSARQDTPNGTVRPQSPVDGAADFPHFAHNPLRVRFRPGDRCADYPNSLGHPAVNGGFNVSADSIKFMDETLTDAHSVSSFV